MTRRPYRHRRRGSTLMEFALIAPILMGMLITSFSVGMALSRTVQAGQVCRNTNVLVVRGFDLSQPQNQALVVRMANGLGLNLPGTYNPDPNGKAVVILTKVIKVGNNACARGITAWDGNPSSCPNYGRYVIAKRLVIGNGSRWTSKCGNPGSTPNSYGDISDYNIAMSTGDIAQNFSDVPGSPTIITLALDEFAYIAEVFADIQDLTIPYMMQMDTIAVRNVS